jgi:uncharacterized protein (TIGR02452 family)
VSGCTSINPFFVYYSTDFFYSVAAYRNPPLDKNNMLKEEYTIDTRKKIESIFAIAHHHEHAALVLSALGCGAFRNPPKHIAALFKSVIDQYAGYFREIVFVIIDDQNQVETHFFF